MTLIRIFVLCVFYAQSLESDITLNTETRGFEDILVIIDSKIQSKDCRDLLTRIKVTNFAWKFFILQSLFNFGFQDSLTGASASFYNLIFGRAFFGKINLQLPQHWNDEDCGVKSGASHHIGVSIFCLVFNLQT